MEKILELFGKEHAKNWWLFTTCFGIVHTCFFWHGFGIGNKNPFFLFLEIILISTGFTRILVAINFLHWVQLCPVIADIVNFCWWERRQNVMMLKKILSPHIFAGCPKTQTKFREVFYVYLHGKLSEWNDYVFIDDELVSDVLECYIKEVPKYYNHTKDVEGAFIEAYNNMLRVKLIMKKDIHDCILRYFYKIMYGFFLQKLWLPKVKGVVGNRKFDTLLMMIIAVWIVLM